MTKEEALDYIEYCFGLDGGRLELEGSVIRTDPGSGKWVVWKFLPDNSVGREVHSNLLSAVASIKKK